MSRKIIIELVVPSISQHFDVKIPVNAALEEVKNSIVNIVKKLNPEFMENEDMLILNQHSGEILNVNYRISELDLRNGSKIILI